MSRDEGKMMEKQPLVSVIIPCYNGEKFIGEAIESVLNQTCKNWELIIVDDKSKDNSKKIVQKYTTNNKIILIEHKYNKGIAKTKNTGIANATGKYIAFLDQDDIWLQQKLELQIKCFEEESNDIGVVCTGMIFTDSNMKLLNVFRGFNDKDQKKLIKILYLKPTNSSSIMMVKKEYFKHIGTFNEELIGWDDYEFLMRLTTVSKIKYIRKPLVKKRIHKDNAQRLSAVQNETEKVFTRILILHPFLKQYENIKESNRLYADSINLFERGDKTLAYNNLKKSIQKRPGNFRAWLLFILYIFTGKYALKIKNAISTIKNLLIIGFAKFKMWKSI
jgi:glycosyltransferase involved in cell wall biosynthesis